MENLGKDFLREDKCLQRRGIVCFLLGIFVFLSLIVVLSVTCADPPTIITLLCLLVGTVVAAGLVCVAGLFWQKRSSLWIRHGYYDVHKAEYPDGYVSKNLGKKIW